jgi:hypothetical protein
MAERDLGGTLDEVPTCFQAAAPGVMGSAVVSIDGFAIGSLLPGSMEERRLSAMQIGRITGVPPKLDFQKDRIILHYYGCPSCEGYESEEPVCFYECGMLMALREWATGMKHKVIETECRAMGAEARVYEIVEAQLGFRE